MEAPIPPPRLDDDEDVHWALSTAGALWGRGEHVEALKWLRRAAEQASDVNADKRALELFKAAADVANQTASSPAPPPVAAAPAPPPAPPRRSPPPPQRAGSVYPGPPAAPRPPSVPAPPNASSPPPAIPRAPAAPTRSVPPPAPSAPRMPQPTRPVITAPTRPVAITAAKPAPQALTPKRRRSFTGEPKPTERTRSSDAGRARHDAPKHHRRRTHTDDVHVQPRVTPPQPPQQQPSIWDDADEDTRVISGKSRGDELEQALTRLRTAPAPVPHGTEPAPKAQASLDDSDEIIVHEESTSDGTALNQPASGAPASGTTAPGHAAPSHMTERPVAGSTPSPAPKRLDTLPALRVAVLATGIAGEVRLISLNAGDEPPPGAAVAVLVPMSAADGEAVARLFAAND